jgi:DNA-binding HxlR family transcriptional regulator
MHMKAATKTDPKDLLQQCSIARASALLGDAWVILLLRELFWGTSTFDEFATNTGMASNILSSRLQRLTDAEIVKKTADANDARRYNYQLTPRGKTLFPLLMTLMAWGDKQMPGEHGPLVRLIHLKCGKRTGAGLVCTHCGEPLKPEDLDTAFNPAYRAGFERHTRAASPRDARKTL